MKKRIRPHIVRDIVSVLSDGRKPVYYASVLIGVLSALAVLLLKLCVHGLTALTEYIASSGTLHGLSYFFPLIGIGLSVLFTRYVVRDDIGHGVAKVLKARARNKGIIAAHNMYSSIAACSLTVGFGGSVGYEAPVMYTGSAIGSNVARLFAFDVRTRIILVGCGSAAAVAAVFKAPIAGIVFALEVLMIDSSIGNKIPLIVSSITGALVSMIATGTDIVYSFAVYDKFQLASAPLYIGLGVFCGGMAIHLHKTTRYIEKRLSNVRSLPVRVLLGAGTLCILTALFPALYGEGFVTLKALFLGQANDALFRLPFFSLPENAAPIVLLTTVLLLKPFATALTTGSGGIGGVFAPSLFMGGIAGYAFAYAAGALGVQTVSQANCTLVGMSALLGALMHSPLTGIFLIAEISGSYQLFIPLLIASVSAYWTHRTFFEHSIYAENLAAENSLVTYDKDAAALMELDPYSMLDSDVPRLSPDTPLASLRAIIIGKPTYLFAVVDTEGRYAGDLRFDDIREQLITDSCGSATAGDFASWDPRTITNDQSAAVVLEALNGARDGALPIVDADGKFQGFLWREAVLDKYRSLMIELTKESD